MRATPFARGMFCGNDEVVFGVESQVMMVPIPKSFQAGLITPTHFSQKQATELKVAGQAKLPLRVKGDSEAVTFTAMREIPGVKVNSKTGEFDADTQVVWNHFANDQAVSSVRPKVFPVPSSWLVNPPQAGLVQPEVNAAMYAKLIGKELAADRMAAILETLEQHSEQSKKTKS